MSTGSVVIVMPAYNEAEGIGAFLAEITDSVRPTVPALSFVIVNDRSTDDTVGAVQRARETVGVPVELITSEKNQGHGPTALAAYRHGLASGAAVIVHVDGDGQFVGEDFPRVLAALEGADAVHGVRMGRTDPWFRRALSRMVRMLVLLVARRRIADVNTPLRAYRPEAVRALLDAVPADAAVPHVHFSILEARRGLAVSEVEVASIPRRGAVQSGTMWGPVKEEPRLPPRRLVAFAGRALAEVVRVDLRRQALSERVREDA